jgi:predicted secreted protein
MPTQSLAGYNGVLSISTDNGSSYQVIGELRDVELTIDTDMLDATSHSSAGWKEKVAGNAQWTATAGALYVNADAGQAGVVSALSGKTKCKFRFDPEGTSVGKAAALRRRLHSQFQGNAADQRPDRALA